MVTSLRGNARGMETSSTKTIIYTCLDSLRSAHQTGIYRKTVACTIVE